MSIDLTQPKKVYELGTVVVRNGERFMGPNITVNANSESHAKEVAAAHGHIVNDYFGPPRRQYHKERK